MVFGCRGVLRGVFFQWSLGSEWIRQTGPVSLREVQGAHNAMEAELYHTGKAPLQADWALNEGFRDEKHPG